MESERQKDNKSTTRNMTEGPPLGHILAFAIPMLFGGLLQQLYSVIDMMIIGRFVGVNALAGVGATGSLNFLIIGLCIGLCSGFSIPIAQRFGAGDHAYMRRFFANSIWLSIIFAIAITAATALLCDDILLLMRTPEEIFDYSHTYIFIVFCGIPTFFFYNLLAGVMRAVGDSKTPLKILVVATTLNIVLTFLLVVVFDIGVAGAAYATVLCQFASGCLSLFYLLRKFPILMIKKGEWKWRTHLCGTLCGMGIPMGIQYSITAIGSVIMQSAVNSLGAAAVASVAAALRVSIFFSSSFDALGNAMATYGGQNVGAGRLARLDEGLKACVKIGVVYSIACYGLIWVFGRQLVGMFVESSEEAILDNAFLHLRIGAAFFIALALVIIYRFLIQGMGFGTLAIVAGVCEMIARIAAALLLVPSLGFLGACLASPLAWIFADLFLIPAYHKCKKKLLAQLTPA